MTTKPISEFIYRAPGDRGAKDLSLHKERDYLTGLSFLDDEYGLFAIKFSTKKLLDAGFIVVNDGGESGRECCRFSAGSYLNIMMIMFDLMLGIIRFIILIAHIGKVGTRLI